MSDYSPATNGANESHDATAAEGLSSGVLGMSDFDFNKLAAQFGNPANHMGGTGGHSGADAALNASHIAGGSSGIDSSGLPKELDLSTLLPPVDSKSTGMNGNTAASTSANLFPSLSEVFSGMAPPVGTGTQQGAGVSQASSSANGGFDFNAAVKSDADIPFGTMPGGDLPTTDGSIPTQHNAESAQSSTYDEISRTAPWLLAPLQPTNGDNGLPTGLDASGAQAFDPLPLHHDTIPLDDIPLDGEEPEVSASEEEDDHNDDPNDQDYAPRSPNFGSSRGNGNKRTRHNPDPQPLEDQYLPDDSDEEHEFGGAPRKKPRKSNTSAGPSTPGTNKCDFVDEHGNECDALFRRPYDMARHKETKHGSANGKERQQWICKQCTHNFSRKDALLRHQRVRHHS